MANYNFHNVDAHEFEEICSEVLAIYLGIGMRVFPEGRDRGIDIKRASGKEDIVGQCKRIQKVTGVFQSEFNKIKKIKTCKKYYLFLACGITAKQRTDIRNVFSDYMDDENYIFDEGDLNSLLEQDEYLTVVKKHFKLWISSEKVFEHFTDKVGSFDSGALINSIQEHRKYYVDTADYYKVLDVLLNKRIVLITGQPGVGKSTISEMALLSFVEKFGSSRIVYSASSDLSQLKNSISDNKDIKELIYIDDFLGDYYLDLRTNNISTIYKFIDSIRGMKNKYLIINSRILILKEACSRSVKFQKSIDKIDACTVEIKNLSSFQRGKILFNHLYFSDIPDEFKKEIIDDKRYWELINHPNYNPRLIEYISNTHNYQRSKFKTYYDFVIDSLNKADKIWDDAIKNNLAEVDRWFLYTMKSFGQDRIKYEALKTAFNSVINSKKNIDTSINQFEECVKRLNGSFVYLAGGDKERFFSFLNPSIKESLTSEFPIKAKDFVALEQFINNNHSFLKSDEFKKMCIDGTINKLLFNSTNINEVYLLFFTNFQPYDVKMKNHFADAICYSITGKYKVLDTKIEDIYKRVITRESLDFFDINSLSESKIHSIIHNIFEACFVFNAIDLLSCFKKEIICDNINDCYLSEKLASDELLDIDLNQIVASHMGKGENEHEFDDEGARNEIYLKLIDRVRDSYYFEDLENEYEFKLDESEIKHLAYGLDLDQEVADYYADLAADMEMDRYKEERVFEANDVDVMFSHLIDGDK